MIFAWNDSVAFKVLLFKIKSKSNFPTAPEKFSGLFFLGKSFTLITFSPVVIVFWDWVKIRLPKRSRLLLGKLKVKSNVSGSKIKFPDFWG